MNVNNQQNTTTTKHLNKNKHMKPNLNSDRINGTSFYGQTISATVEELRKVLGEPSAEQNDGSDKVNFEWWMENDEGDPFTVYDWKEYRTISEYEIIEWHIGAHNELKAITSKLELQAQLVKIQVSDL